MNKSNFSDSWCFLCCDCQSIALSLYQLICNVTSPYYLTHDNPSAGSYIYITGLREASDRGLAMVLLGFLMFTPGRYIQHDNDDDRHTNHPSHHSPIPTNRPVILHANQCTHHLIPPSINSYATFVLYGAWNGWNGYDYNQVDTTTMRGHSQLHPIIQASLQIPSSQITNRARSYTHFSPRIV